jgi:hypothetical protein
MTAPGSADGEKMFQAGAGGRVEELRLLLQGGARVVAESRVCGVIISMYVGVFMMCMRTGRNDRSDGSES